SISARMTGISCNSPIASFGPHVNIVQLKTSSPLVGDFHFAHRPAITICALSAMVGAPTPDGFAFVPLRAAFLGDSRWVVEPGSEAAASPSFLRLKEGRPQSD